MLILILILILIFNIDISIDISIDINIDNNIDINTRFTTCVSSDFPLSYNKTSLYSRPLYFTLKTPKRQEMSF